MSSEIMNKKEVFAFELESGVVNPYWLMRIYIRGVNKSGLLHDSWFDGLQNLCSHNNKKKRCGSTEQAKSGRGWD